MAAPSTLQNAPPPYEAPTYASLDSAVLNSPTNNPNVRQAALPVLLKPIAIPNTTPDWDSPFLRAYPPALESYHLSRELFLKFIDDINRIAVQSPPLQALSLVGGALGFVPELTAQIVGQVVSAVVEAGMVATSLGRTELYLRDANRTIFEPRGLKCEIAKIEAVAKIAGIPILNDQGKVDKETEILGSIDEAGNLSTQHRRMQALLPYTAELDLTPLPEVHTPKNWIGKMHVKVSEWQRKSGERHMLKSRARALRRFSEYKSELDEDLREELKDLDEEAEEIRQDYKSKPERMQEKLGRIEEKRARLMKTHEEELTELAQEKREDDKEEKGMRKLYFILVREKDADSGQWPNPDME